MRTFLDKAWLFYNNSSAIMKIKQKERKKIKK